MNIEDIEDFIDKEKDKLGIIDFKIKEIDKNDFKIDIFFKQPAKKIEHKIIIHNSANSGNLF